MKNKIIASIIVFAFMPLIMLAGGPTGIDPSLGSGGPQITTAVDYCQNIGAPFQSIGQVFNWASCTLIKSVVPLLFTLAVVGFIWGVITFFLNPENEEKRKAGKSFMIWGLIALFVLVSIWGLVGVLTNTFGVKTVLPQLSQ